MTQNKSTLAVNHTDIYLTQTFKTYPHTKKLKVKEMNFNSHIIVNLILSLLLF